MKYLNKKTILVLEDGTIFYGKKAGAIGTTGELCFNTGMTGIRKFLQIHHIMVS